MDWIEVIVHTTTPASDLVTETLINSGAQGTMVEDRADVPDPTKPNGYWEIIDPHMIDAMPEDVLVHAWFEPDASFPDRLQGLKTRYAQLLNTDLGMDPGSLSVETRNVKDQDWNEVWKQFYKPFRAGTRLVVKPTWEAYEAQEGDLIIATSAPGAAFSPSAQVFSGQRMFWRSILTPPRSRWPKKTLSTIIWKRRSVLSSAICLTEWMTPATSALPTSLPMSSFPLQLPSLHISAPAARLSAPALFVNARRMSARRCSPPAIRFSAQSTVANGLPSSPRFPEVTDSCIVSMPFPWMKTGLRFLHRKMRVMQPPCFV